MDILQIQFFLSATVTSNFTVSAAENNISQSSFSKHIMALENELGTDLFFRNRRSISLTPAGERFQEHAYKILSAYKSMTDDMAGFSTENTAFINIFSIPVIVQYNISNIVSDFRALHPKVHFNLTEEESYSVLHNLRRLKCDFAILRTDFLDPEQYNMIPVNVDKLVAIVPENHPLALEERIPLRALKGQKLILPTDKASLFDICMLACKRAGFTPEVPYTVSGKPEITIELLKKENIIALAMERVMSYFDMSGCKIVELEEEIHSTTALVQLKSNEPSAICRKFMAFIRERSEVGGN